MSLALYMDHHVHGTITRQLRHRGVSVITAEEDGRKSLADPALLDRAGALGCILVTNDTDLLAEASRRQRTAEPFSGIVYAHQMRIAIGTLIDDLHLIAQVYEPSDIANAVQYLPL